MIFSLNSRKREERFAQMFTLMYPKLVRYACQLLGDGEEARDIVSGVMHTAWEKFGRAGADAPPPWLYTATRNAVINRMKHLRMEQERIAMVTAITQADADDGYARHEQLLQTAERIAAELGEPTRTILRRCYWERKTYAQVAAELGISPNTVKKHISKALATLRLKMKNEK